MNRRCPFDVEVVTASDPLSWLYSPTLRADMRPHRLTIISIEIQDDQEYDKTPVCETPVVFVILIPFKCRRSACTPLLYLPLDPTPSSIPSNSNP
jgi:hypothetical protein